MEMKSRIPVLREVSSDGALMWFSEMQCQKLLFHPEEDPADIVSVADNVPLFSTREVEELRFVIGELDSELGHEKLIEAAYPVFMRACGIQLDA
jgi:hypothetical protein